MFLLFALACKAPPGPGIAMDFAGDGWLDAPFPGDHRLSSDGADVSGFPNPEGVPFIETTLSIVDGASGFGATSGIAFRSEVDLDASSLPTLAGSLDPGAAAMLVDLATGALHPITADYRDDGGPFGAERMLTLLPLQGAPLRPNARYAAVLTTALETAAGEPVGVAPAVDALRDGDTPAGLADPGPWLDALEDLEAAGHDLDAVAAMAVLTTWDPTAELDALVDDARGYGFGAAPRAADFAAAEVFDDYCVFEATVQAPVYQQGEPPYLTEGGAIAFDGGAPMFDRLEDARLVVTVPAGAPPAGGWPVAVFVRTGGGGDRPLVDRGVRDADGEAIEPGTGPALEFARAGYAGLSVDGPHGGLRNVTGGDEQFLIFNVTNPAAMRDNVRQSALELALLPDLIADLSAPGCDPSGAGDTPDVAFTLDGLTLMGHSMGATIGPLTFWAEPRFTALILSGAGGSWIENIVYKESPLDVRSLAEAMIGYAEDGYSLHSHDPALSLLQWAGEPADPPVYADPSGADMQDRHVLMLQGIVDTYILPPIANTTSLAYGLDLGGPALDADHPELTEFTPLEELLAYSGGQAVSLPTSGAPLRLVTQHLEDGVEDGHEVVFQTALPKAQYRCLLEGILAGEISIPGDDGGGCG